MRLKIQLVIIKGFLRTQILDTTFPLIFDKHKLNALCCDLRVESLNQLVELFNENLKIIYIVRNGIEVVASRMIKKSNSLILPSKKIAEYGHTVKKLYDMLLIFHNFI